VARIAASICPMAPSESVEISWLMRTSTPEALDLFDEPVRDEPDVGTVRRAPSKTELPAEMVGALVENDVVTAGRGDSRRFESGRSPAHHQDPARGGGASQVVIVHCCFATDRGVDSAAQLSNEQATEASVQAPDARARVQTGGGAADKIGVGNGCPYHRDHRSITAFDDVIGLVEGQDSACDDARDVYGAGRREGVGELIASWLVHRADHFVHRLIDAR
jgi:hypothetical protein